MPARRGETDTGSEDGSPRASSIRVAGGGVEKDKQRRKRTKLSPEQIKVLIAFFNEDRRPNSDTIQTICSRTNLTAAVVKTWFQNKAAKVKREERTMTTPQTAVRAAVVPPPATDDFVPSIFTFNAPKRSAGSHGASPSGGGGGAGYGSTKQAGYPGRADFRGGYDYPGQMPMRQAQAQAQAQAMADSRGAAKDMMTPVDYWMMKMRDSGVSGGQPGMMMEGGGGGGPGYPMGGGGGGGGYAMGGQQYSNSPQPNSRLVPSTPPPASPSPGSFEMWGQGGPSAYPQGMESFQRFSSPYYAPSMATASTGTVSTPSPGAGASPGIPPHAAQGQQGGGAGARGEYPAQGMSQGNPMFGAPPASSKRGADMYAFPGSQFVDMPGSTTPTPHMPYYAAQTTNTNSAGAGGGSGGAYGSSMTGQGTFLPPMRPTSTMDRPIERPGSSLFAASPRPWTPGAQGELLELLSGSTYSHLTNYDPRRLQGTPPVAPNYGSGASPDPTGR